MDRHKLFGFTHVDQTGDASYFIRFLDAATASDSFQAYKQLSFELLEAGPGKRFLDVGCGTGDDVRALAARVVPGGEVIGIDGSQAMIDAANQRGTDGLPVRFAVADAHQIQFADGSFDGTRCDRTFMHLADPTRTLAEMVRVTRPGGMVVVYEVDFGAITIDVPDKRLTRLVLDAWCDSVRDGWRGRRLPGMFRDAGLRDIRVIPHVLNLNYEVGTAIIGANSAERARTLGMIRDEEAREWVAMLEQLRDRGEYFCTLTGFLAVARR